METTPTPPLVMVDDTAEMDKPTAELSSTIDVEPDDSVAAEAN